MTNTWFERKSDPSDRRSSPVALPTDGLVVERTDGYVDQPTIHHVGQPTSGHVGPPALGPVVAKPSIGEVD